MKLKQGPCFDKKDRDTGGGIGTVSIQQSFSSIQSIPWMGAQQAESFVDVVLFSASEPRVVLPWILLPWIVLPRVVLPRVVLPRVVLPLIVLPRVVLPWIVLPWIVLPWIVLPWIVLPWIVLPRVVLPWIVLRGPLAQRSLSIVSILPLGERVSWARSRGGVLQMMLFAA